MRLHPYPILLLLGAAAIVSSSGADRSAAAPSAPPMCGRCCTAQATGTARQVILRLRLPRVLAAFGTGASLAVAGALMQVLVRNPLADPYILGTSGGAATFALTAMLLGAGGALVDLSAFAGALVSTSSSSCWRAANGGILRACC